MCHFLLKRFPRIRSPSDITQFITIVPDFITTEEEEAFVHFLQPKLQRRRYEADHFDAVIQKYKETELPADHIPDNQLVLKAAMSRIFQFLRTTTNQPAMVILPPHVIDLHEEGHIGPHVDSIKFSGGMISGLSLLSSRVMRLTPCSVTDTIANDQDLERLVLPCLYIKPDSRHDATLVHLSSSKISGSERDSSTDVEVDGDISSNSSTIVVEMQLPRRSLYIITGPLRYTYTHAVVSPSLSQRRISVMFRDKLMI